MANPTFIHGGINTNGDIAVTNADGTVQFTIDNASGTNNQVLTLNGSNVASWADIPAVNYADLVGAPTLFDGDYNSLTNLPTLFDGDYGSLTNVPSTFTPSAHTHPISNITNLQSELDSKIPSSEKGAANGVATLDSNGLVPSTQLPSYVDDVVEYANESSFPGTGETGKLYVDLSDNSVHRWTGSTYVNVTDYATPSHTHTHDEITDFDTAAAGVADTQIAAASIGDLSDVDITTVQPSDDQVLAWDADNSEFVPTSVSALSQADAVSTLTDVTLSGLAAGELLVSTSGNSWENKTPDEAGLATSADIANMMEDGDSITVLGDVTNIGNDGDLIVNNNGSLEGASTITHDKISDFDTEATAIANTQILAADISDLRNVHAAESANEEGDVLVWDGGNATDGRWVVRSVKEQAISTDDPTFLTGISQALSNGIAAIQVDYVITNGSSIRCGILHAVSNGTNYEISDLSTIHAGAEAVLPDFECATNGGTALAIQVENANGYTVKYTVQNLLR